MYINLLNITTIKPFHALQKNTYLHEENIFSKTNKINEKNVIVLHVCKSLN